MKSRPTARISRGATSPRSAVSRLSGIQRTWESTLHALLLALLPDGRLIVSTLGNISVTGASGADEDLIVFTPATLGATTSGTWAMYFDGSDVGLSSTSNEDVNGMWVDASGKIYLTTLGSFGVTGVSGDGSDIITCTPGSLGSTTTCTWAMYWDGSVQGFAGEVTDSVGIIP